jgi:dihydropteroate synthase
MIELVGARGAAIPLSPFAVMGVINVTPDSFYDASRKRTAEAALEAALSMAEAGAALVDVGGESTRPGAAYVGEEEELERVIPAIEAIRARSDVAISVDTRKSRVAKAALDAGADLINDVSALEDDPDMTSLAAARRSPVILMHKKGVPESMQDRPYYEDCPAEVFSYLIGAAARAIAAGVPQAILDPGIGFGKRLEDNLALLSSLDRLTASGYPVLVGLSRKSFIGAITGRPSEGRLPGSLAAACAAFESGALVFRVHDVAETRDALAVYAASRGRANGFRR